MYVVNLLSSPFFTLFSPFLTCTARNDAYFTSRDLCRKFGDPVVEFDYPQCTSKMRDVMFNYTDSNGTWVFSLQVREYHHRHVSLMVT